MLRCPAEKPVPPTTSKMFYVNGSDAETGEAWPADRDGVDGRCVVVKATLSNTHSIVCKGHRENETSTVPNFGPISD